MGRNTKMLYPWATWKCRYSGFCRKILYLHPEMFLHGWEANTSHLALCNCASVLIQQNPVQTPTGMRGGFTLHGLSWLGSSANWHWQLIVAIYSNFHVFLPIHGPSQENPIPRIQILVNHREEEAHRERNHAAHSSWEKLRGGCSGFQLRDAQSERSL